MTWLHVILCSFHWVTLPILSCLVFGLAFITNKNLFSLKVSINGNEMCERWTYAMSVTIMMLTFILMWAVSRKLMLKMYTFWLSPFSILNCCCCWFFFSVVGTVFHSTLLATVVAFEPFHPYFIHLIFSTDELTSVVNKCIHGYNSNNVTFSTINLSLSRWFGLFFTISIFIYNIQMVKYW